MKIGIMGAIDEEVAFLKKDIQELTVQTIASREYCSGKLYGMEATVVFSRWGKVAAASTATTLMNIFNVDLIIFTGVAGAAAPELNIGDVVIADKLFQHDMDARPILPKHVIPLLGGKYFHVQPGFLGPAQLAAEKFLSEELPTILTPDVLARFSISQPKVVVGAIASGDQFISDPKRVEDLLEDSPETKAVEMEGAAVAQVCYEYEKPYIVFRTISDKADHSAAINFQKFIAEISNYYSRGFMRALVSILSLCR